MSGIMSWRTFAAKATSWVSIITSIVHPPYYRFHITDPLFFEKSFKFTIEHGHNNVLPLDLASVACWYLDKATGVKSIPDRTTRQPMPIIGPVEMHKWRHNWRTERESKATLWGNEK
jgi:hypothetical protein